MNIVAKSSPEAMRVSHSTMVLNEIAGMTEKLIDRAGRLEDLLRSVIMQQPQGNPSTDNKKDPAQNRPVLFNQIYNQLTSLDEQIDRIGRIADSVEL